MLLNCWECFFGAWFGSLLASYVLKIIASHSSGSGGLYLASVLQSIFWFIYISLNFFKNLASNVILGTDLLNYVKTDWDKNVSVCFLFLQLFTVGNNLLNCVWQELDGVAEWFIRWDIGSDNHSWLKRSLAAARFEQFKPVTGTIFVIFQM